MKITLVKSVFLVQQQELSINSMIEQQEDDDLKQIWTRKEVRQYITRQIAQANLTLLKTTPHDAYLVYRLPPTQHLNSQIRFIIHLSKAFPVSPPQVFSADSFITPSIKSYADYLTPILKQPWHVKSRLDHITQRIADFVEDLYQQKLTKRSINEKGGYYRDKFYNYSILKQVSDYGPFVAFQIEQQTVNLYVATVTSFHFILFKPLIQPYFIQNKLIVPRQEDFQRMKIDFLAEIESLAWISHNRQHKHEYTFVFKGNTIDTITFESFTKKLKIRKSEEMVETLLKSAKHCNMLMEADLHCVPKNSEEEHLLYEVRMHEQKLKHYFNKTSVNELNHCYQKLVEFYSSVSLPYQQIYLQKMMQLHCRHDVNLVLSASSPTKKTS